MARSRTAATPAATTANDEPTDDKPTDDEPAIDVEDLALTYADGTEAVRGVDLRVPNGEFFGFLGPNGAGKTTTSKLLATLLRPTAGEVRVNGYDATERRRAVRGTIGYMAQETSIDEELTARENLDFACEAYGIDGANREERIAELLDLVDLADVADEPAAQFSGGMKKRLDAATALVHDPALVFLDEPTTGLDPKARNRLWAYFERVNADGTTFFLTTQYLEEADALCDRLAVIRDGEIVESGSPAALKRRVGGEVLEVAVENGATAGGDVSSTDEAVTTAVGPSTAESTSRVEAAATVARRRDVFEDDATVETADASVRITTEQAGERGPALLVALREAGIAVREFSIHEPSLDDVFLAIADEDARDLAGAAGRNETATNPDQTTNATATNPDQTSNATETNADQTTIADTGPNLEGGR